MMPFSFKPGYMANTSTVKYTKKRLLKVEPIQASAIDPAVTVMRY